MHKRWAFEQQAKKQKKLLTMETLLGTPGMMKPLANYIEAMDRFGRTEDSDRRTQEVTSQTPYTLSP